MTTRIQDDNTNGGTSFLMGFLAAGAVGAGLALCFFAPRLAS